jgi:predicted O-linked N-acetylglucosamine transferase (SPINDLY family)
MSSEENAPNENTKNEELNPHSTGEDTNEEQEQVKVAEGHELEVLPANEEEEKEEILTADSTVVTPQPKIPAPQSSKTKSPYKRNLQQTGELDLADVSKKLDKQRIQINKIIQLVQPVQKQIKSAERQLELVKQLQSQLKQLQKQVSQVQKKITNNRKQKR